MSSNPSNPSRRPLPPVRPVHNYAFADVQTDRLVNPTPCAQSVSETGSSVIDARVESSARPGASGNYGDYGVSAPPSQKLVSSPRQPAPRRAAASMPLPSTGALCRQYQSNLSEPISRPHLTLAECLDEIKQCDCLVVHQRVPMTPEWFLRQFSAWAQNTATINWYTPPRISTGVLLFTSPTWKSNYAGTLYVTPPWYGPSLALTLLHDAERAERQVAVGS